MNVVTAIQAIDDSLLPTVVALQNPLTPSTLESAQRAFAKIKQYPAYDVYLAFHLDVAIGTFALLVMDNLGHLGAPLAVVENVVVAPAWRRKGVGREMMSHALAMARASGCYKLILASNIKLTDGHAFYESLGFRKQGYAFSIDL